MKSKIILIVSVLFIMQISLSCTTSSSKDDFEITVTNLKEKSISKNSENKDYLADGIILAGSGDRVGGPYTVNFYAAEVLIKATEATKNEVKVRLLYNNEETWTAYIAKSRPATKEDLKPGMIVFSGQYHNDNPNDKEALSNNRTWYIYRVKDISNLYKNIVILTMYDGYWSKWRDKEIHFSNIRILENEMPLELIEF